MSITDTIKEFIGAGGEGTHLTEYRCEECGQTFDSAKTPDRVQCMECLSKDVVKAS